jgi:hypothetical protein
MKQYLTESSKIPYVYKWTELSTGKWYIGCKTGKNSDPKNHEKYICSSKFVKPMILKNRQDWKVEFIYIGTANEIQYVTDLECKLLKEADAKNNPMSYNLHNGDGKFTIAGKKNPLTGNALRGRKRPELSFKGTSNPNFGKRGILNPLFGKKRPDHSKRMSGAGNPMYGVKRTELAQRMIGVPRPQETLICPHCNKAGGRSNMKRYHFENCKVIKNG